MVLRLVALSSSGFTEIYIDDEGAMRFAGPEPAEIIFLNGLSWPTREVELPYLKRQDCFFLFRSGEALGSPCGPGLLHHYTAVEKAIKILDSGALLLSPYMNANDDYERASRWFDIYCPDESGKPGLAIETSKQLDRMFRSRWAFASFSNDQCGWQAHAAPDIDDSEGWQHPGMWAHYGGRHRKANTGALAGAVLVFERKEFIDAALIAQRGKALIFGNVRYADKSDATAAAAHRVSFKQLQELGLEDYSSQHFRTFWREYHLTKFGGWSYENEARIAINTSPEEPCFVPFQQSLKHVLIGEGASAKEIDEIDRLGAVHGAQVSGVRWRNGMPVRVPTTLLPR